MILGDWAPNFVVDTKLHSAPVFNKLANDDDPVGKLRADYILTTHDKVHIAQWRKFRPACVQTGEPRRRLPALPVHAGAVPGVAMTEGGAYTLCASA